VGLVTQYAARMCFTMVQEYDFFYYVLQEANYRFGSKRASILTYLIQCNDSRHKSERNSPKRIATQLSQLLAVLATRKMHLCKVHLVDNDNDDGGDDGDDDDDDDNNNNNNNNNV
jgi:hypothetical protein